MLDEVVGDRAVLDFDLVGPGQVATKVRRSTFQYFEFVCILKDKSAIIGEREFYEHPERQANTFGQHNTPTEYDDAYVLSFAHEWIPLTRRVGILTTLRACSDIQLLEKYLGANTKYIYS